MQGMHVATNGSGSAEGGVLGNHTGMREGEGEGEEVPADFVWHQYLKMYPELEAHLVGRGWRECDVGVTWM